MQEKTRKESWAEEALGVKKPRSFIVDASVLDDLESHEVLRDEIKQNHIEYEFPDGLNKLDLFEECRALALFDDFEAMYDVTMQLLAGKSVVIRIKHYDGTKTELCSFQVVDRYQDLRGVAAIDEYPCLVRWLTEFMGAMLLKKYPVPLKNALPPEAPGTSGSRKPKKPKPETPKQATS
jgi:hypothetical protein